ncbi:MAG: ABC transporter permease [Acidimicrobiia bacterium]
MTTAGRTLVGEARKLPAFFRRDLLVALSYPTAFVADWGNLLIQMVLFATVGALIQPGALGQVDGRDLSYPEFVAVGIAVAAFTQVALNRVVSSIRNEQLIGTLESVLLTPTTSITYSLGSVMYDIVYVPIRTMIFLFLVGVVLDVQLQSDGILPTVVVLLAFIPLVWGIGMVSAAATLTLRRGGGITAFFAVALTLGSTAYFPLEALPSWARGFARQNPLTLTMDVARGTLLGDAGWELALPAAATLLPMAAVSLALGVLAFRFALWRERRKGTLGLY